MGGTPSRRSTSSASTPLARMLGLDAARQPLVRADQRDRYGGPGQHDFDIRSAYMVADPNYK